MAFKEFGRISSRFIDTVGDGSGATDMAVLGTPGAPVDYCIQAASNEIMLVEVITVSILDNGTLDTNAYGNGLELTNGILPYVEIGGFKAFFPLQVPLLRNVDWMLQGHATELYNFGSGPSMLQIKWDLRSRGQGFRLHPGNCFGYRIQDDLSGLEEHRVHVQYLTIPVEE